VNVLGVAHPSDGFCGFRSSLSGFAPLTSLCIAKEISQHFQLSHRHVDVVHIFHATGWFSLSEQLSTKARG
jgi:hypothetical protein